MNLRHTHRWRSIASVLCACFVGVVSTQAADTPAVDPLGIKQQTVKDRLKRLEDRLFRTRQALSEREPENVERIEQAIQRLGELGVASDVEAILALLNRQQYGQAGAKQVELLDDLRGVLKLLVENKKDPDKQKKEAERLEAIQRELNEIIKEQRAERLASKLADPDALLKQGLKAAIEAGEKLIADQQAQAQRSKAAQTDSAKESPEALAKDQDKLGKDAEALAEQLEELEHAQNPKASHDKKNPLHQAHEETSEAAKAMDDAKAALDEADLSDANKKQQEAVEKLKRAIERLKELAKKADAKPNFEKMSEDQKATAERAGGLEQKMASKDAKEGDSKEGEKQQGQQGQQGEKGEEGESGKSEKNSPPQPPKPLTPGQQNVAKAKEHMEQAKKKLDEGKAGEAGEQQDKAVKELEQAKAELEEELAQKRKEQQEQALQDLEERFSKMLEAQKKINGGTVALHKLGTDHWKREDELKLGGLSKQQKDIGNDAMRTLKILDADGSTVVFPRVVRHMAEDMFDASDRLGGGNVALATQRLQEAIVTTLKELLGAIKQQQSENKEGGGGGGGGGGGAAPLLPGSAELKMLRSMQIRVNTQTKDLDDLRTSGATERTARSRADVLGRRQDEIGDMAREMHERQLRQGP